MSKPKIAIVYSEFNRPITDKLLDGAKSYAKEAGLSEEQLTVISVPGAVELPLVAKLLAKQQQYDAIVLLGAVIQGETRHFDYVCQQVSDGCQQIMLEFELPVIFGVLTTEDQEQALDRLGGRKGHKGMDAMQTALVMIDRVRALKNLA